jgi:hypothetical protein
MVGLEIGSSMPDAAIRKRIVGGLKLEVRGKNVKMHRDSHRAFWVAVQNLLLSK